MSIDLKAIIDNIPEHKRYSPISFVESFMNKVSHISVEDMCDIYSLDEINKIMLVISKFVTCSSLTIEHLVQNLEDPRNHPLNSLDIDRALLSNFNAFGNNYHEDYSSNNTIVSDEFISILYNSGFSSDPSTEESVRMIEILKALSPKKNVQVDLL